HRQSPGPAKAGEDAALVDAAGENHDDVLPEGGDAGLDLGFGASAKGHHGNHGADTDNDAEHGQDGAQFIAPEGAKRNFNDRQQTHSSARKLRLLLLLLQFSLFGFGEETISHGGIADHPAIAHDDHAFGVLGNVQFVGHHHDG